MKKRCFKCSKLLPISEYYRHDKMSDGHLNKCKSCTKKDVANNPVNYDLTEKGVIRVIYKTQKRNNMLRGFGEMPYSKAELSEWLYLNGFKRLFEDWVSSNYEKDRKPSADRIDSLSGYSLTNIKLGTWFENRNNPYHEKRNGAGSSGKQCKKVKKMDFYGKEICTYPSRASGIRDVGYCFDYAIKNKTKCKKGFYWCYEN